MPILNYTTEVPSERTVAEIQAMLVEAGASEIRIGYALDKTPASVVFEFKGGVYVLPSRMKGVQRVLNSQKGVPPRYRTEAHSARVGWRIMRTWVAAQLAIIESGIVDLDEVMFPYRLHVETGKTLFDSYTDWAIERAK